MAQKDIGNKVPLHTLRTTNEVRDFYDDWGNEKNMTKICVIGTTQDQKR